VTFIKGGMKKMTRLKKLSSWLVLVIILLAGFNVPSVSAQEDFTITVGEDKEVIITEFNYHNSWFEDDPNNPEPWPDQREAYSEGNIAYVSLSATPGHAGEAHAWVGVEFEWDLGPYAWEEVKSWPVEVTIDFSYHIEAYWATGNGSANAGVHLPSLTGWNDFIGYETGWSGSRGDTVSETCVTTVEELGGGIIMEAYCQAHSVADGTSTHHSSAEVQINSIKIEILNPQITHFLVSLEYSVGPNEEERYGQGVVASVYHPQGSDQLSSFIAIDPTGKELPWSDESTFTSNYWNFMWWDGGFTNPPTFGTYTIVATDNDGHSASVTSWPTNHISNNVPTITYPENHGFVTAGNPTFRWEPYSDTTTGYLIEVLGPPEETLPGDDAVWRIGLPSSQTEIQFNSDGTAAVPQLTSGNTYNLLVFAFEDVCSGIQCYRDTSMRTIEFIVSQPPTINIINARMVSPNILGIDAEISFPDYDPEEGPRYVELRATINGQPVKENIEVTDLVGPGETKLIEWHVSNIEKGSMTRLKIDLSETKNELGILIKVPRFTKNEKFNLIAVAWSPTSGQSIKSEKEVEILLPVIIVHGYTGEQFLASLANIYGALVNRLKTEGYTTDSSSYQTLWFERYSSQKLSQDQVSNWLDGLVREAFDATYADQVNIIGHSLGGLVGRNYINNVGNNNVHKLIMVGTPNKGSSQFYIKTSSWSINKVNKKFERSPLAQWLIPTYEALYDIDKNLINPPIHNNFPNTPAQPGVTYYSIYNIALETPYHLIAKPYRGWYEVMNKTYYQIGGDGTVPWESANLNYAINKPLNIPTSHAFLTKDATVQNEIIKCLKN
jgi:pimeloyl-ACP methyl ester carboxylesterase